MTHLPEISEDQRNRNVRKLINQNKKLRQEIFVFQQQLNVIFLSNIQQEKIKSSHSQLRKSTSLNKKSSNMQSKSISNILENVDKISHEEIDKLLETNSPLIETRIIPCLKQKVQILKAQNIKQNVHYILKQEDDLKILKKELYKLRKQKQVITEFVKDKCMKLQKSNTQLISYKNDLREQLSNTIKFNRQSSAQITQLERQVRKYHLTLQEYKKLSALSLNKDSLQKDSMKSMSEMQKEVQEQIKKVKAEINSIQNLWKPKIQALDIQYYPLKEQLAQKLSQQNEVKKQQSFQKTRILTMKDQGSIQQQKQRLKLAKVSPRLQKQLQEYLKEEQQKLRKKQQYLKKHRPRDKDEEIFNEIITTQAKIALNPEKTQVQTQRDDKNIIKLKNYLKKKVKQDKQIEANLSQSFNFPEKDRMKRSWTYNQPQIQDLKYLNFKNNKKKDQTMNQKQTSRPLLKSIKMGTTSKQQYLQKMDI